MEEVWLEPLGGVMIGMHRDVFASGRFFFEHLMANIYAMARMTVNHVFGDCLHLMTNFLTNTMPCLREVNHRQIYLKL